MEAPERARSMAARATRPTSFCLATERMCGPPVGGTFWFQIFIQASSPEIWSETISGGEEVLAGKWGGLFSGYLLGRNFRRRDRDHLVPPRWMDAAVYRAEVCYPFGRKHGRHRAVKRREFITLLGGAAAAWPLAAHAQPERMRRIGVLNTLAADDALARARQGAFLQGLQQSGWTIGRNVQVEARWAAGDPDRLRKYAVELVALAPDVILASGNAAAAPVLQATRTVPIVFVIVPDPVGAGFVDSLPQPGGNATGFLAFEYGLSGKWLELLKDIAPGVTRVAVLRDPALASGPGQFAAIQSMAPSLGVEVSPVNVRNAPEIERTVAAF